MIVIIIESPPPKLNGELTQWCLQPKPNVFVGNVNALVRESIWAKICNEYSNLNALMIYSSNNEQGYRMNMIGDPKRHIIDLDGIQLIEV